MAPVQALSWQDVHQQLMPEREVPLVLGPPSVTKRHQGCGLSHLPEWTAETSLFLSAVVYKIKTQLGKRSMNETLFAAQYLSEFVAGVALHPRASSDWIPSVEIPLGFLSQQSKCIVLDQRALFNISDIMSCLGGNVLYGQDAQRFASLWQEHAARSRNKFDMFQFNAVWPQVHIGDLVSFCILYHKHLPAILGKAFGFALLSQFSVYLDSQLVNLTQTLRVTEIMASHPRGELSRARRMDKSVVQAVMNETSELDVRNVRVFVKARGLHSGIALSPAFHDAPSQLSGDWYV
jgi:hypothetical protein